MSRSPETKITVLELQMQDVKKEVEGLRKDTKEGFDRLEHKLDCYVTKETYNKDMKGVYDNLKKNSGTWDWVVKTVMGLVIGALVTRLLMG
jgi:hypothetical protein